MVWHGMAWRGTSCIFHFMFRLSCPIEGGLGENFDRIEEASGENSQEPGETTRRRNWTPLQLKNPEYLETLKNREITNRDFIMENIVSRETNVVGTFIHENKVSITLIMLKVFIASFSLFSASFSLFSAQIST